jgi:hypothetical protein
MADKDGTSEADLAAARDILIGAIAAAGANGAPSINWQHRVDMMVPHVAAMMEPGSDLMRRSLMCLDVDYIGGYFQSAVEEKTTGRLVVTIQNYKGEEETIRTEHVNTMAGADMKARLAKLAVGDRILIYKAMEPMAGERGRLGQKARLMINFKKLRNDKDAAGAAEEGTPSPSTPAPRSVPAGGNPSPPAGASSEREADPPPSPAQNSDFPEVDRTIARLDKLPTKVKLSVKRQLEEQAKWPITFETMDAALVLITLHEEDK